MSLSRDQLSDPMYDSPAGSSVHGILQARILEWVAFPFSKGIFSTLGWIPGLLHCRWILYHLSHQGNPSIYEIQGEKEQTKAKTNKKKKERKIRAKIKEEKKMHLNF